MPTRNIVLTQHQSSFVEVLVASGKDQNASEGLRLMAQREMKRLCDSRCCARQSSSVSAMSRAEDSLNSATRPHCVGTLSG